jgi:hypothetical protein
MKPKKKVARLTKDDQGGPCPKGGKHSLVVFDYIICTKCGNAW